MKRKEFEKKIKEIFKDEKYVYGVIGLFIGSILGKFLFYIVCIGVLFYALLVYKERVKDATSN